MRCIRKQEPLDVVRFTGDNRCVIDDFIGTDGRSILIYRNGRIQQIQIHFRYGYVLTLGKRDYLARNSCGKYERINNRDFDRKYEVLSDD